MTDKNKKIDIEQLDKVAGGTEEYGDILGSKYDGYEKKGGAKAYGIAVDIYQIHPKKVTEERQFVAPTMEQIKQMYEGMVAGGSRPEDVIDWLNKQFGEFIEITINK